MFSESTTTNTPETEKTVYNLKDLESVNNLTNNISTMSRGELTKWRDALQKIMPKGTDGKVINYGYGSPNTPSRPSDDEVAFELNSSQYTTLEALQKRINQTEPPEAKALRKKPQPQENEITDTQEAEQILEQSGIA